MITLILGIGAAILPFVPFILKLGRIGGLVFRLKREKIAHEAVGEPFPLQYDRAIEQHTETVKRTGYKMLLMGTSVMAVGMGFLWYGATAKIEEVTAQRDEKERMRALAVQTREDQKKAFVELNGRYETLVKLNSEASTQREGLITVKTKAKVKRAVADAKRSVDYPVDADSWLRIESASGAPGGVPTSAIPDSRGVPERAG